jgi:hypothetical protein
MKKHKCLGCGERPVAIEGTKCIECKMGINPELNKSDPLKERQLSLRFDKNSRWIPKRLTIFHLI